VTKHERQHHAYRCGALVDLSHVDLGHGVIRLRSRTGRLHLLTSDGGGPSACVVEKKR
jgi:hypothetical protein